MLGTPGDQRHCWCQFDRWAMPAYRAMSDDEKRGHLVAQVSADAMSPGVIARIGDEPVGWASVAPRPTFPRIGTGTSTSTAETRADLDDAGIWSVTCFVVRTRYRRQGVSAALLDAAVDHARSGGAHTARGLPGRHRRAAGRRIGHVPRAAVDVRRGRVHGGGAPEGRIGPWCDSRSDPVLPVRRRPQSWPPASTVVAPRRAGHDAVVTRCGRRVGRWVHRHRRPGCLPASTGSGGWSCWGSRLLVVVLVIVWISARGSDDGATPAAHDDHDARPRRRPRPARPRRTDAVEPSPAASPTATPPRSRWP